MSGTVQELTCATAQPVAKHLQSIDRHILKALFNAVNGRLMEADAACELLLRHFSTSSPHFSQEVGASGL